MPDTPHRSRAPSAPRILVRLTGTLGDALVSLPALRALRAHFGPAAEFHLLHDVHPGRTPVPEFFECEPIFTQNFGYPKAKNLPGKLRLLPPLVARLRKQRYDAAVLVTSCTLSRWTVRAERRFLRLCGITQFVGFEEPQTEIMLPHDAAGRALETERDMFWRLRRLEATGVFTGKFIPKTEPFFRPTDDVLKGADAWLRERKLKTGGFWAVAPLTGTPAKDWPAENWQKLFQVLGAKSPLPLVILGSKSQRAVVDKLAAHWPGPVHNTCGELTVGLALGVLSRAHRFIGMDALPSHAAGAMGVPGVVIFQTQSHPGQWVPWSPHGQLIVLRQDKATPNLKPEDVVAALARIK